MKRKQVYVWAVQLMAIYAALFAFLLLLILRSESVMEEVMSALLLCCHTMIPSLFPFFVLSGLFMEFGFAKTAGPLAAPVMRPLFRVSGSGAAALLIGLLSGYPTGSKLVAELYKKRLITKTEGMRLLPFCNNSGPLFVVGAVGVGMLGSIQLGVFLFVIHVLSAFLVGICFRFYGKKETEKPVSIGVRKMVGHEIQHFWNSRSKSSGTIFTEVVHSSVQTTLLVCGFIVLFSAINVSLRPLFSACNLPMVFERVVLGMLEVSMGAKRICELYELPMPYVLSLLSFLIGFGGACVHLQVLGMLAGSGLSMKTYLVGKSMQAVFAAVLTALFAGFLPETAVSTWSGMAQRIRGANEPWIVPLSLGMVIIFYLLYRIKRR